MKRKTILRFDVQLATELYTETLQPIPAIATRLGLTENRFRDWLRWQHLRRPKRLRALNVVNPREAQKRYADRRQEANDREREAFGDMWCDVQFLRSRGFTVLHNGGHLLIDFRPCNKAELKAKAGRERRLCGMQC